MPRPKRATHRRRGDTHKTVKEVYWHRDARIYGKGLLAKWLYTDILWDMGREKMRERLPAMECDPAHLAVAVGPGVTGPEVTAALEELAEPFNDPSYKYPSLITLHEDRSVTVHGVRDHHPALQSWTDDSIPIDSNRNESTRDRTGQDLTGQDSSPPTPPGGPEYVPIEQSDPADNQTPTKARSAKKATAKSATARCGKDCPVCEGFKTWWNAVAEKNGLPAMRDFGARRAKIHRRFKEKAFSDMKRLGEAISAQPLLHGEMSSGWRMSVDWLLKNEGNVLKVLEGNYGRKSKAGGRELKLPKGVEL
jgi:hypothetical protein